MNHIAFVGFVEWKKRLNIASKEKQVGLDQDILF